MNHKTKILPLVLLGCLPLLADKQLTQEQMQSTTSTDTPITQEEIKIFTPAQQKSGFIVGVEVLFGQINTQEEISKNKAPNQSVMGRFFGGYQHYFDENLGIRALGAIQDGTPVNVEIAPDQSNTLIKENILSFWIGTELDMLWDFYSKGDHTLGLSLGLGYNFEIYRDRKVTYNNAIYPLPQFYQHNLYPIIGLHYYYDQHQFGINYRFIGTLNSAIKEVQVQNLRFQTKITYDNFLNFSYTYRF